MSIFQDIKEGLLLGIGDGENDSICNGMLLGIDDGITNGITYGLLLGIADGVNDGVNVLDDPIMGRLLSP